MTRPRRGPAAILVRAAAALVGYAAAALLIGFSFPLALLLRAVTFPFDRDRMVASRAVRFLGELLIRCYPLWRVSVEGTVPASGSYVVVPNHRSMVDALAIACLPRETKWVGKVEAFRVPWLGWAFSLVGYIPVLRGDRDSGSAALARARGYLARGVPVGLFAEGTRSRDGTLRPFKPGPFKLAIDAGVPLVPVAIAGAGTAMPADQPWIAPSRIRVRILPALPTAGLGAADVDRLRESTFQLLEAELQAMEAEGAGAAAPPPAVEPKSR